MGSVGFVEVGDQGVGLLKAETVEVAKDETLAELLGRGDWVVEEEAREEEEIEALGDGLRLSIDEADVETRKLPELLLLGEEV